MAINFMEKVQKDNETTNQRLSKWSSGAYLGLLAAMIQLRNEKAF